MDWLQDLLWNPNSVAHIVFLYAFVVAAGVYLGKIKIFGVSLGVTFVLFAGILMGHFGFTGDTHILHFIREFGLILFVFCIGLQVGPSFFSSFKKGGMTLNMLAVGIVVLNIAVAMALYFILGGRIELPMMVGILYGAVTNTPGLGAAQEALNQLSYSGPQIALGYACAYPLGVVGIIGSIIAVRYIFRINFAKEEENWNQETDGTHHKPHLMSLEVHNEAIYGKTLGTISSFLGRPFVCSRIRKNGHVSIPNHGTILEQNDQLFVVCSEEDSDAIVAFIGREVQVDWEKQDMPMVSRRILVTKPEINGKKLGMLNFRSMYNVNITRVNRSGVDLFANPNLILQVGDRVMVVGSETHRTALRTAEEGGSVAFVAEYLRQLAAFAQRLGHQHERLFEGGDAAQYGGHGLDRAGAVGVHLSETEALPHERVEERRIARLRAVAVQFGFEVGRMFG